MVYLQMNNLTKLFRSLVIGGFFIAQTCFGEESKPLTQTAANNLTGKKISTKIQTQAMQENIKLVLDKTIFEDESYYQTISSISIPDSEFPMDLITIDELSIEKQPWANFEAGQIFSLRSTDSFASYLDIVEQSNNNPNTDEKEISCNQNEFLMFAILHKDLPYTGVIKGKNQPAKHQWFEYGNYVCVKIDRKQV
jgi:hypothetical protein